MRFRIKLALAVTGMVMATMAHADGFGVDAKIGTLGYGAEIGYRFNDYLGLHTGINTGTYDFDKEDAGIDYSYGMDFDTLPILIDWYVFGGGFRLTGGFVSNDNKLSGKASGALDIGDGTYTTTATSDISFDKSSTYVGLGWGGVPSSRNGFGMSFDLGVLIHGSPKATLSAAGVSPDDLAQEQASLNDDLKDFKYWPVISLGIGYTF